MYKVILAFSWAVGTKKQRANVSLQTFLWMSVLESWLDPETLRVVGYVLAFSSRNFWRFRHSTELCQSWKALMCNSLRQSILKDAYIARYIRNIITIVVNTAYVVAEVPIAKALITTLSRSALQQFTFTVAFRLYRAVIVFALSISY